MATYKHGVYGEQVPFQGNLPISAVGTYPAYIGTAPIQQVNTAGAADFDYTPYINRPLLINGYSAAQRKMGYSADWKSFTLCEAVSAHFLAGNSPVGPIIVVNMADPSKKKVEETETPVALTGAVGKKVGTLDDPLAAIENITIDDMTLNTDYTLAYGENGKIIVTVTKSPYAESSVTLKYNQIDVSQTTMTTDAFGLALEALDLCDMTTGYIPNILAAPGWSHLPTYHELMIDKVEQKISEKWYAICCSDIPADSSTNTPTAAISWKSTNGYTNKLDKVCWPMQQYDGDYYHLSTLAVVDMQNVDTAAGGIPYISPSNKVITSDGACLDDGTEVLISEPVANTMNEVGITTVNIILGQMRLWGPHMANYDYEKENAILPEDRQDTSVRVPLYMMNYLQRNYIDNVDNPMSRREKDAILASVQQWINSMVNQGALLYGTIQFLEDENPENSMISGDFVFNIQQTNTPNGKSLTFKVQYVTDGLSALTGGENA